MSLVLKIVENVSLANYKINCKFLIYGRTMQFEILFCIYYLKTLDSNVQLSLSYLNILLKYQSMKKLNISTYCTGCLIGYDLTPDFISCTLCSIANCSRCFYVDVTNPYEHNTLLPTTSVSDFPDISIKFVDLYCAMCSSGYFLSQDQS